LQKQQLQNWPVAVVLGVLGTIQYHLAQFSSGFDTVFGDRGDVRGVVYFCEHWYRWLIGKADLMSPAIFYPTKHTLAYSDYLVGYAIPYSFARQLGFGMFSSLEIVVILFTFLSYLACYVLLKHVLKFGMLPASAGSMFFAFSSPKFHQLPHIQLQYVVLLPLIFACVLLFVRKSEAHARRESAGWVAAAVLLFLLQATTAFYYAWFLVFWTLLFVAASMALRPSRRFLLTFARNHWRDALPATVVLVAGSALFALSYLPGLRNGQWYKYDFVIQMIPSWWSLIWMGEGNYLWGWLSSRVVPDPRPSTWNELRAGFGLIATAGWCALTLWTIWRIRSRKGASTSSNTRNADLATATAAFVTAAILATSAFFLIAFNYDNHSPWFFVYTYFPAGKAIRAVARYVIFLSLPMAIVFAFLLDRGLQWAAQQEPDRRRKAVTAGILLIAALGVFEQFGVFKVGATGFSKKTEEAYLRAMAAKLPGDCAAFYVTPGTATHSTAEYQYDAMMISIVSGVPTLNASMSQFPPGWELYFVGDGNYETNVRKWIESNGVRGKVCRLEIDPQVEAFNTKAPTESEYATYFVQLQFRDLAGSEGGTEEVMRYAERLQRCKATPGCAAEISLELFRGTGFQDDGSFVLQVYQTGLGRAPRYDEFNADLAAFRAEHQRDKLRFTEAFIRRPEFAGRYSAMPADDYLAKLIDNAKVNLSKDEKQTLLARDKSQAELLHELADSPQVSQELGKSALVTLHYFGYLRREPDATGFANWRAMLERTGDLQQVTAGFITSLEYRRRFPWLTQ
jgi:hypothetical protein